MISLNSVRPFCWFHTYYLITTRFQINNAKISHVIILLSNRTLSALKCPVYKGFQKIFYHFAPLFDIIFVNSFDIFASSPNRRQNQSGDGMPIWFSKNSADKTTSPISFWSSFGFFFFGTSFAILFSYSDARMSCFVSVK